MVILKITIQYGGGQFKYKPMYIFNNHGHFSVCRVTEAAKYLYIYVISNSGMFAKTMMSNELIYFSLTKHKKQDNFITNVKNIEKYI